MLTSFEQRIKKPEICSLLMKSAIYKKGSHNTQLWSDNLMVYRTFFAIR